MCSREGIDAINPAATKSEEVVTAFRDVLLNENDQTEEEKKLKTIEAEIKDKESIIALEDKAIEEIDTEKIQLLKSIDNTQREMEEKEQRNKREHAEIAQMEAEHKQMLSEIETGTKELEVLQERVKVQPMSAQEARALRDDTAKVSIEVR